MGGIFIWILLLGAYLVNFLEDLLWLDFPVCSDNKTSPLVHNLFLKGALTSLSALSYYNKKHTFNPAKATTSVPSLIPKLTAPVFPRPAGEDVLALYLTTSFVCCGWLDKREQIWKLLPASATRSATAFAIIPKQQAAVRQVSPLSVGILSSEKC